MQVRGLKSHIRELTGAEPPTCPWRAFYDPLVAEVVGLSVLAKEGLADAALGPDPPWILLEGTRRYLSARNATAGHDADEDRKRREAQRPKKPPR